MVFANARAKFNRIKAIRKFYINDLRWFEQNFQQNEEFCTIQAHFVGKFPPETQVKINPGSGKRYKFNIFQEIFEDSFKDLVNERNYNESISRETKIFKIFEDCLKIKRKK